MSSYGRIVGLIAGVAAGVSFLAYCVYFDKKRRSDPLFRQKLKERRLQCKNEAKKAAGLNLPDMKDQEAVQKFFLEEVQKGEECLAINDVDNCVKHLTNAIAVCGQPQQLLGVFKKTLPPNVFQMLIQNIALLGSAQMQQTQAASAQSSTDDTDVLD